VVNPPYFKTGKSKTANTGIETKKPKVAVIDTKGKVGGKGKTDGKSAGGSGLMSPGLLGGGPGLGTNGPSSVGMAPGAGGMGSAPLTSPVSRLRLTAGIVRTTSRARADAIHRHVLCVSVGLRRSVSTALCRLARLRAGC
jgi:hypothetical protein